MGRQGNPGHGNPFNRRGIMEFSDLMLGLTWEQWLVYGSCLAVGAYIGLATMRNREKGKTDTFAKVPYIGRFTAIDYWMPKTNREKNQIVNKAMIMAYTAMGFMMGGTYLWIMVSWAGIALLYDIPWFKEDGS